MKLIIQGNVRHKANLVKTISWRSNLFPGRRRFKVWLKENKLFSQQQKVRNVTPSINNCLNIKAEVNAWELVYITEWFIIASLLL